MLFVVIFHDKPEQSNIRKENLAAHIQWLDEHSEQVLVGGSCRHEPSETPIGAMWIVTAESKEAVHNLMQTDPFWEKGLRSSVEVLHWSKAFEDREVLV